MKHDFRRSLEIGQRAERAIAHLLSYHYFLRPASRQEQKNGIDFIGVHRVTGRELRFEIKCDLRCHQTGNGFIEVQSSDSRKQAGWAYSSRSDLLIYVCPGLSSILFFRPCVLRQQLTHWQQYPRRSADNGEYKTWGLCVPLPELEAVAEAVAKNVIFLGIEESQKPKPRVLQKR